MSGHLEDLRRVEEAEVHKAGRRVGRLTRTRVGTVFAYDPGYAGPAVATTLPVGGDPVHASAGAVPPFFAGMLPEGRRLAAVRAAIKTSADDDFSLLLATAHDAIGDVQVVPMGWEAPPPAAPVPRDGVRFADLMSRVLGPEGADRVALPGVQDKVSSGMISLPVHFADGPFLLKLDPPEFPHLVANEAFFLEAARRSGLKTAEALLVRDRDGAPGLLVRRFDRVPTDGGWRAVPQEDACQVLGRYPADKYRLSTEEVLGALAALCGAPRVAARDLVRQAAFAFLTCNGDAHAKNFSIRHLDGEWAPTPAYDVPSSHPYGDTTVALPVNGKSREDIGRGDFLALGAHVELPPKATSRVLDDLADAASGWLPDLHRLPYDRRRLHKLRRAIEWRRDRLAGRQGG